MKLPSKLLGMGTWGMGGKFERDATNIEQSVEILKLGLSLGLERIDTAELYGEGCTEEIVGRAIAGTPREKVRLTSKVWRTNMKHDDVLRAAQQSLARLKTPYLDLYLVHWPNPEVPLQETMRAMEKLVDMGLAKTIGVSNFSVAQMEEAQSYLSNTTLAALQTEYNLLNQSARKDLIPYCKANSIEVTAYRPFAKGKLTEYHSTALDTLALKYRKTQNQIALNWILAQSIVAIPATLNAGHLRENIGALDFILEEEDIALLLD